MCIKTETFILHIQEQNKSFSSFVYEKRSITKGEDPRQRVIILERRGVPKQERPFQRKSGEQRNDLGVPICYPVLYGTSFFGILTYVLYGLVSHLVTCLVLTVT